jgi:ferric-dicitrate binding protein FerR (iron transport regulator)
VLVIALGAAIYVATRERDGRWTVLEGGAPAVVYVDGRDIDSGAAAELARALEGARTLATTTGPLRFELERVGRFELGERSELVLELVPEAGASDELVLELRSGALRVITVEPLAPTRVRVRAPDGEVRVVGTEFAVDIIPGAATCICCTRGAIEVSSRHHAGERLRIPAGGMAWCPSDGSATKTEDVVAEHRAPIEALRAVER